MTDERPRLALVGGIGQHSGKTSARQGKKPPGADKKDEAVRLLRALAHEIETGKRPVEDIVVVHTAPPIAGDMTADIAYVSTRGMDTATAYFMLGRLQNRMALIENAGSVPELLED